MNGIGEKELVFQTLQERSVTHGNVVQNHWYSSFDEIQILQLRLLCFHHKLEKLLAC
jgi:hypothetical protein